jgi:hypothetical protein
LRQLGATVAIEPSVPGSADRADLRVTGPLAPNHVGNDVDFGFAACTYARWNRTPAAVKEGPNAATQVREYWMKKYEQLKRNKYEGKTEYTFAPLIITTGGSVNLMFKGWIKRLRSKETGLRMKISALLLRYSARITHIT